MPTKHPRRKAPDPRDLKPQNAWILKADDASYPRGKEMARYRRDALRGTFTCEWTAASQTRVGDLLLIYYVAPRKAVHFVARAASTAYFSTEMRVNARTEVADAQWWIDCTPPIEIEPIPYRELGHVWNGQLILRGKSGKYVRPEVINQLQPTAIEGPERDELKRVFVTPVGLAELPKPDTTTPEQWRNIAAGALTHEHEVSQHVVEPLLRLLLRDSEQVWRGEVRAGLGRVDYAIFDNSRPTHAIEVKKAVRTAKSTSVSDSPDYAQLRKYMKVLGSVPGTLMDSNRIILVDPDGRIRADIARLNATKQDLSAIQAHWTAD